MCTALTLKTNDSYFGRTLDLDRSYGEEVCVVPRSFPFRFRKCDKAARHYAIIGMATVIEGTPLFYDGANEHGLAMAGLNFPENAYYAPLAEGKDNIAPFEVIPWLLGQCKTVSEAKVLLSRINITDISFSDSLPNSPLHFIISDGEECLTVEPMQSGLHIYENKIGVLTNNPPFPYQLKALENYNGLRIDNAKVMKNTKLGYSDYCQGLGAVGLPGDVSSMSRFARIAFLKEHSISNDGESASVSQFFHLLSSVEMIYGACKTDEGNFDFTGYTSCINTDRGIYYYTTYSNRRINAVDMHKTDLNGDTTYRFALQKAESINHIN